MRTRRLVALFMGTAAALAALQGDGGGTAVAMQAPAAQAASAPERTVWYFYRVKWGHQDEFLDLFAKNHYPVLKAEKQAGRITAIRTFVPTYHGDGRADWTFAVSLTYRDAAALTGPGDDAVIRRLFPDQAAYKKEEQRRFEILDAHWDVPLNELDLDRR